MMAALISGERDPKVLVQKARSRMRTKIGQLEEAFNGHFGDHHRFLLARMLVRIDGITADIAALDEQIEAQLTPFAPAAARLDEIPGIGPVAAAIIIAEVGLDMSRFPTAGHLCSWAKFSPGINSSAGKWRCRPGSVACSTSCVLWQFRTSPSLPMMPAGSGATEKWDRDLCRVSTGIAVKCNGEFPKGATRQPDNSHDRDRVGLALASWIIENRQAGTRNQSVYRRKCPERTPIFALWPLQTGPATANCGFPLLFTSLGFVRRLG
ncbi:transposase [Nocardia sp. CA-107356]|uniref:transposase n=1 Tax=Nocardia sp. CA-107356 TaxID=3239972 RepID=UPI003D89B9E3